MKTIANISVKGGTGKTLNILALAYKLRSEGFTVGVFDSDIDSPNMAEMLELTEKPKSKVDKIEPVEYEEGMKIFSMAPFAGKNHISKSGQGYAQIIRDVSKADWGDPDFMLIDLPAGSSDIFKTVLASFAETIIGMIIVSQPANTLDFNRCVSVCNYYKVPILGVIENMSGFVCPHCSETSNPLGHGEVLELAEKMDVPIIGSIPISVKIRDGVLEKNFLATPEIDQIAENVAGIVKETEPRKEASRFWKAINRVVGRIERALAKELVTFFTKFIKVVNQEVDISALQERHDLTKGRAVEVNVTWSGATIFQEYFRVRKGKLRVIKNPRKVEGGVVITASAVANIMLGQSTFYEAWLNDDLQSFGDKSTDAALFFFNDCWTEVEPQISEELGPLGKRLLKIMRKGAE